MIRGSRMNGRIAHERTLPSSPTSAATAAIEAAVRATPQNKVKLPALTPRLYCTKVQCAVSESSVTICTPTSGGWADPSGQQLPSDGQDDGPHEQAREAVGNQATKR